MPGLLKSLRFFPRSRSARDLVIVMVSTIVSSIIIVLLEIGDYFFDWAEQYEYIEVEEYPFVLLVLAVALGWFAYRRSQDHRVEAESREQELAKRKQAEAELREARDKLEEQVEARTRELGSEVAERLSAERTLRRRQMQLVHMNRLTTMGEMVSVLVHEVNQPLSAIVSYARGCVELLRSGADKPDELLEAMHQVLGQSKRATEIIAWVHPFVERIGPQEQRIDLNALVREAAQLVDVEGRSRGITLELGLAEPPPTVWADALQLQQVVVNLALNGMAAISAQGATADQLKISTMWRGREFVELTVQDSGPGLHADMLEKVFEPFYTTKDEGLGMGLAICRSIVGPFGGRLWATSDGTTGAAFHVRLPALDEEPPDDE